MSYRNALVFTIALFISNPVMAKDTAPVLSDLWLSKSIGVWEKGKEYGYFKVLVYRMGLEHAGDKIRIIITQADTKNNHQIVKYEKWLESPGYKGFVDDISLKMLKSDKLILGVDVEMKEMDGVILKEVYIVDLKGKVKKLVDAKYKNIYTRSVIDLGLTKTFKATA